MPTLKKKLSRTPTSPAPVRTARSPRAKKTVTTIPLEERIAERAYFHWLARGCPDGSPQEDWFHAERDLASR
jgi:hypothetical protein